MLGAKVAESLNGDRWKANLNHARRIRVTAAPYEMRSGWQSRSGLLEFRLRLAPNIVDEKVARDFATTLLVFVWAKHDVVLRGRYRPRYHTGDKSKDSDEWRAHHLTRIRPNFWAFVEKYPEFGSNPV
jgi:hypothetical protein